MTPKRKKGERIDWNDLKKQYLACSEGPRSFLRKRGITCHGKPWLRVNSWSPERKQLAEKALEIAKERIKKDLAKIAPQFTRSLGKLQARVEQMAERGTLRPVDVETLVEATKKAVQTMHLLMGQDSERTEGGSVNVHLHVTDLIESIQGGDIIDTEAEKDGKLPSQALPKMPE